MTTNREDLFEDKKSEGDDGEKSVNPKRRQRVRLTREEMQAMTERKRRFERVSTEDEDPASGRKNYDYGSRPRTSYGRDDEGTYRPRRDRDDEGQTSSAPSYRERYRAEHAGEPRQYRDNNIRRNNYGSDRDGDGYKPRKNYGDKENRPYGQKRNQNGGGYNNNNNKDRKPFNKNNGGGKGNFGPQGQKAPNAQKKAFQKPAKQRPHYELQEVEEPEKAIRLNKFLAHSGVASRREADELILAGAVVVNGTPVLELGTKVLPTDRVEVNGKPLSAEEKVYILLNKPRNVVTTTEDPQERLTVLNLVKNAGNERIYPVGRLDRNTTGVLLLTNDGDLASKLVHPSFKKKKIYQVWLDKEVAPEDMQKLADGIELSDGEMHADAISYVDEEDHTQVGIEIHSGKNRIVRRLFEALGYRVIKLDRVYFAGLTKKNLGRGKWRYLTQEEVINLKNGFFE